MAITYKKLAESTGPMGDSEIPEGDEWKYVCVEESATQSPVKKSMTYAGVKAQLDSAEALVASLTAQLAEVEAKAKS